jgi:uncharacterized protein (DUF305 family)
MQGWLRDWYGVTHDPELDGKTQRQIRYLSQLTGEAFEKAFMMILIEHHAMAVESGLDCLKRAYHPEMINMCAMMISAQADEIAQLRLWLAQWYSITDLKKDHRG